MLLRCISSTHLAAWHPRGLLHPGHGQLSVTDLWLSHRQIIRPGTPRKLQGRLGVGPCMGEKVWVSLREGHHRIGSPPYQASHLQAGLLDEAVALPLHCVSHLRRPYEALHRHSGCQDVFDVQWTNPALFTQSLTILSQSTSRQWRCLSAKAMGSPSTMLGSALCFLEAFGLTREH